MWKPTPTSWNLESYYNYCCVSFPRSGGEPPYTKPLLTFEMLHDYNCGFYKFQYAENFAANMVDARMLDNLSKKELEKYLGVTRKFHQASIVHGIHLLRLMKYDRQVSSLNPRFPLSTRTQAYINRIKTVWWTAGFGAEKAPMWNNRRRSIGMDQSAFHEMGQEHRSGRVRR